MLLIESTRRAGALVIPAGKVEACEADDYAATALRETEEEAGAKGDIVREVEHDFVDAAAGHCTRYFVLRVTTLLKPSEYVEGRAGRRRHWVPRAEAVARLRKPAHREAMAFALGGASPSAAGARAKAGGGGRRSSCSSSNSSNSINSSSCSSSATSGNGGDSAGAGASRPGAGPASAAAGAAGATG